MPTDSQDAFAVKLATGNSRDTVTIITATNTLNSVQTQYKKMQTVSAVWCPRILRYILSVNDCYRAVNGNLDWSLAGLERRSLHVGVHPTDFHNSFAIRQQ